MTFEEGRTRTCRFPARSALLMLFKQSARTEVRIVKRGCMSALRYPDVYIYSRILKAVELVWVEI